MKYLLRLANAIAQGKNGEDIKKITGDREPAFEQELSALSCNERSEILKALFPNGVLTDSSFYGLLQDMEHYTGFKPLSRELKKDLWVNAYNLVTKEKKIEMLQSLLEEGARGFWTAIHVLPGFCSQVEIEPQFAAEWFLELAYRVKGYMAGGSVFRAVREYAFHNPNFGLTAFEKYVSEGLDGLRLDLAAILLGTVRSRVSQGDISEESVQKWDDQFQNDPKTEYRLCYYKSLVDSFDLGTLSIKEYDVKLSKMLDGVGEEIDEAFNTVYRCLLGKFSDKDFISFAMNWFSKNVSGQIPDLAKYCVVDGMWRLCSTRGKEPRLVKVSEANKLLSAIQPIPNDNLGTWHQLEYYLVDRLHEGPNEFEEILKKLTEVNADGLLAQFKGQGFDYLKSEISKSNIQEFITNWLVSTDDKKRKIGRLIFQEFKLDQLSEEVLSKADELKLEIALLEFIQYPLLGEKTSQYLISLEPNFKEVSLDLKDRFKREMILQAINYRQACLEKWKKIRNPSDLLKDVITDAEQYFEDLENVKDSPAINFSFPEYKAASEKSYRDFSNKIVRGAREKSIIAKLAKNIEIIYGTRWSIMVEGKLGKETSFSEISSSMEFPRLEIIDPEGMALRRLQAARKIRNLVIDNAGN